MKKRSKVILLVLVFFIIYLANCSFINSREPLKHGAPLNPEPETEYYVFLGEKICRFWVENTMVEYIYCGLLNKNTLVLQELVQRMNPPELMLSVTLYIPATDFDDYYFAATNLGAATDLGLGIISFRIYGERIDVKIYDLPNI